MYDVVMNLLRRIGLFAVLCALAVASSLTAASAATISEVVEDVSATGVYLEGGVSISDSDATEIVSAARNNGSRFYLVVLTDTPLGGNTAYAESVFEDLNVDSGTVLVLSPEDVGWVSDNEGFTEDDLDAAYEFANSEGGNDAEYAANFVIGLVGEATVAPTPEPESVPVTTVAASSSSDSSGGGGSGLLIFFMIIVAGGLLLWFFMRRSKSQSVNAAAEQMAKARGVVQKQVDAIANDILDLEDEVRVANNAEVDEFYNAASATYRTVTERLQQADTPHELVELSNDLDIAIWQLDSAEALLDGKPKPPKPERKQLPEPSSQERVTIPAPRPDYQRRAGRRSSYMGSGLMEILIGVAGQVMTGGGRGRGGGLGGMLGRPRRSSSPSRARGSSSGGGGVVPGPGSPVPRSSRRTPRRSSPSRSSRRRSGGGRVRGGGKRRRG